MSPRHCLPRHVLITGASSGLGAGLARSYAASGVTLALTGRCPDRLEAVAQACRAAGAEVRHAILDIADAPALSRWLRDIQATQPIELAIANAGTSGGPAAPGVPEGLPSSSRQVHTNLLGCMNTIEPVLPGMLARHAGQIAVVASVAGYRGLPYSPAYSASKAGVRAYGEALRALLAPSGVAVSVVVPGFFDSPMTDRFQGATPLLCSTAQAVAIVRSGLDRRAARIVFPRLLGLGLQAADLLPAAIGDRILRHVMFRILPDPGNAAPPKPPALAPRTLEMAAP